MTAGHDIITAARGWIGTPYRHQASLQGVGCDCLGLIRGIWRDCIGPEPEPVPPYSADWSEPQGQEWLWQALLRHFHAPAADPQPGDLLLLRMRAGSVAKHLGILSHDPTGQAHPCLFRSRGGRKRAGASMAKAHRGTVRIS